MAQRIWRLLDDGEGSGPYNMGLDEALLRSAADDGVATLRLYTWSGPWLSLGYAQRRIDETIRQRWAEAGVGFVRRTTGGRAVLHGNDLTYSLAAPEGALRPGLRNSYDQVATALLAAIRKLGAEAATRVPARRNAGASDSFDCFAAPAGDEIVIGAEKLVGSAQRRLRGAVLQHGSIRVAPDPPEVHAATGIDPKVSISLRDVGLETDLVALREALRSAFADVLDTCWAPGEATPGEREQARARVESHRRDPLSAPRSTAL